MHRVAKSASRTDRHANPGIAVSLITRADVFDVFEEPVDAPLHYGQNDWPGVETVPLVDETMTVVAGPKYVNQHKAVSTPAGLSKATLLQHMRRPNAWAEWLNAAGKANVNAWFGPGYRNLTLLQEVTYRTAIDVEA